MDEKRDKDRALLAQAITLAIVDLPDSGGLTWNQAEAVGKEAAARAIVAPGEFYAWTCPECDTPVTSMIRTPTLVNPFGGTPDQPPMLRVSARYRLEGAEMVRNHEGQWVHVADSGIKEWVLDAPVPR